MAGAGYKLFNTGDVLTAAQVNTYLMEQTVMVFANAAARTTALSGVVSEGMISYLKDTNAVEVYDGSNWVSSDDPNAIQNTIVDAKGDLISASAADVPARLAVGNNGESLVADSSASTGLRYIENYAAGKNRIINGAMLIDQRNNGASVTVNASGPFYTCDRWRLAGQATDGVFTAQQDNDAPSGFAKSIKITTTTADASLGATQTYSLQQYVEGLNVADFGWGAAGAKTVTISFWVRSSLTGTFGGSVRNADASRSYPFSYSISSANTWEKKSITIAGDTTGTWLKDSGLGFNLTFSLGAGADRLGTAGAWASANYAGATGQTSVIGTLNATWYITGVQLEIGSVATAFTNAGGEFAGELVACQRYLPAHYVGNATLGIIGQATGTGTAYYTAPFAVQPRVAPTGITISAGTLKAGTSTFGDGGGTGVFNSAQLSQGQIIVTGATGLTAGNATYIYPSATATILWTGCEL